jgi:hypothetical protein
MFLNTPKKVVLFKKTTGKVYSAYIHFVRIRKNVNIYFFVSILNKEINIYACIYAYK